MNSPAEIASAASFAGLLEKLDYLPPDEVVQVRNAYKFADQAHLGVTRKSGEPYITHPIAVAALCAEWKLDSSTLMAALLHDTMEDCGVTKIQITEDFNATVAHLVDGVTKLDKLQFSSRQENQAESFRKMLLAMADDVRVILIKLADRTHNMRTMDDMKRDAQMRIATETLEIYAPIANRMGLNNTYRELEDLSFKYLHPWRYRTLNKAIERARSRRRHLVQEVQANVEAAFSAAGLKARIFTREKTILSVYRKMDKKKQSFAQVYDIFGFRIIVPSNSDCYLALGILHSLYKPMPQRLKDFIAIPKDNGYQSLHTTLVGPAGVHIEFQMRTEAMHLVAETGVAAHWQYKSPEQAAQAQQDKAAGKPANWLKNLLDIQKETLDSHEFLDHVRLNVLPDDVFVFTPKNRIMSLPRGATVIDFAYAIHSDVGDQAVSCTINNREAPLRTELVSGDRVEVHTEEGSKPNPAWLSFVRTARARSRIRNHLKVQSREEARALGLRLLQQAYRAEGLEHLPEPATQQDVWDKVLQQASTKSLDELLIDIGQGKRITSVVAKHLAQLMTELGERPDAVLMSMQRFGGEDPMLQQVITLDGSEKSSVQYASCCHPLPGDDIVGYLSRGEGLVVHTAECPNGKRLQVKDSERFVQVEWAEHLPQRFLTAITVTIHNRVGSVANVTGAIANADANIVYISMSDDIQQEVMDLRLILQVRDRVHLARVMRAVRRLPSAIRAMRVKSA
ncbi:bifunctional (p)ppGpp synthetase/guanosine-3',5'-bis(diphosphate) 3'-pyrophosphohydrolase [Brachymonas sp. G13]|uniref:RelA/SpoT family protein n=1 Tax=Brachymonas TaxID=28219 RepID=UPI002E780360|nr:bifunctional (p)ppGpp synthetase/guanosine-3',5'-bis(diphosphate) 3'-pyrophosphohydrolase [Brachymonas sp. J145]MEE1654320.1 bifunctional (p)ppGpp synthetase/guanosine-3',5'-bis(diphosphate) 3'-pyrophosphohydrolase [Brachymonas sp. J145]